MIEFFFSPSECINKFGEQEGLQIWEATNRAFDAMPIAAVIDKKVGGFTVTLSSSLPLSLTSLPSPLPLPPSPPHSLIPSPLLFFSL